MERGHRVVDRGGRGKGGTVAPSGAALVRNTLLNLIGQVAPLLVAVVTVPFVVRGLGEARFGLLALSWAVLGYFGVFDLVMGRAEIGRAACSERLFTAVISF